MTNLPVSNPTPIPRETLYSYLSRLAATWRTEAPDLAHDMGAGFKRLLDQDEEAFDALACWVDLDTEVMAEVLSWTGVRAGNVRIAYSTRMWPSIP